MDEMWVGASHDGDGWGDSPSGWYGDGQKVRPSPSDGMGTTVDPYHYYEDTHVPRRLNAPLR